MLAIDPNRSDRHSAAARRVTLLGTGALTATNAWSGVRLIRNLLKGREHDAARLLATGGAIWITNVIAFGLWYWLFDGGGPARRSEGVEKNPDLRYPEFMFPQMGNRELADPHWEPGFVDYRYLSFTNAAAFSPTDVLPLSRWAKLMMLVQSLVSLVTVALVIARAVNILK